MTNLLIWKGFWGYTVGGLALGSIYALIALGYTLVYGVLRLINFAHSEIFMVGTFGVLIAATKVLGIDILVDNNYPYKTGLAVVGVLLFGALVAMLFSGLGALLLERAAYRPLRGAGDVFGAAILAFVTGMVLALVFVRNTPVDVLIGLILTGPLTYLYMRLFRRRRSAPRLAFLISAIGASTAISEAVAIWGPKQRNQYQTPRVLEHRTVVHLFDTDVQVQQVVVIIGALLMMVALALFVQRTRLGRGVRAVAQDVEAARLMGVDIDRVIMITFILGGVMAGGAAAMFTLTFDQTRNNIGFLLGVKAFTAAVMGGIGNLKGALLGGIVLGLVENYGSALFGGQWKDVIAFTMLLVVLMFRPTGLLGETLGRARA